MKYRMLRHCTVLLTALLLTQSAGALELECGEPYRFSAGEFSDTGVLMTRVPEPEQGSLFLGNRQICAGDGVTPEQLERLIFVPSPGAAGETAISCLRMTEQGAEPFEMTLKLGKAPRNLPPTAENSEFVTYKNVSGEVMLTASDPEGETLTVQVVQRPKRGDVQVSEDGAVTYTPHENKVGRDSFTYTVTDPAGQTSEEATVRVQILKPTDQRTYGDMTGDPAELAAVWMRETGLFTGETVSGQLLFGPDKPVSRGEFLAMCAGLVDNGEDMETVSTGFADEAATAEWLGPFVTTALRCGYLSGVPTDGGLILQADGLLTQAQAVKLVGGLLGLEQTEPVMGEAETAPVWAAGNAAAMAKQSLYTMTDPEAAVTRREAALLLYRAAQYAKAEKAGAGLLAWAAK